MRHDRIQSGRHDNNNPAGGWHQYDVCDAADGTGRWCIFLLYDCFRGWHGYQQLCCRMYQRISFRYHDGLSSRIRNIRDVDRNSIRIRFGASAPLILRPGCQ